MMMISLIMFIRTSQKYKHCRKAVYTPYKTMHYRYAILHTKDGTDGEYTDRDFKSAGVLMVCRYR